MVLFLLFLSFPGKPDFNEVLKMLNDIKLCLKGAGGMTEINMLNCNILK
jgi:hypothetical protein